jgi:hypothetical protein
MMARTRISVFIKTLDGKQSERELYRLLRRYKDRIIAIAIVVEVEKGQVGSLARHYRLQRVTIPPEILLADY